MKIMFVSDIHGSSEKIDIVKDIYYSEKPDKIIFLGDLFYGYDSSNLIVGGDHIVYLVDLNTFNIKQSLEKKYETFSICPVNDKIFLTTGNEGTITQWKFEDGKITKQHEKENLANEECLCMKYWDNGKILLGDAKKLVIIE